MNQKHTKSLKPERITHDMVRELQQLRQEIGTLAVAKEIVERGRDKAEERAKMMSNLCLSTVSEYKRRIKSLIEVMEKEAPAVLEKWFAEDLKCQDEKSPE